MVAGIALVERGVRIRHPHGGSFNVGRNGVVRIRHPHGGSFSVGREGVVRTRHPHGSSFNITWEGVMKTWHPHGVNFNIGRDVRLPGGLRPDICSPLGLRKRRRPASFRALAASCLLILQCVCIIIDMHFLFYYEHIRQSHCANSTRSASS